MTCPICKHDLYWPIVGAAGREPLAGQLPDEWRLCRRCSNAYPSHPPDHRILNELWALNRIDDTASAAENVEKWAYRRHIAKLGGRRSYALFGPLAKGRGRFLDIGCGLGETVRAFADHGWEAEGIDADPSTASVHHEIGVKVRIGQFEHFAFTQTYDIIHIAHAIYFITDPMQFLRGVRNHLAPGGLFCIVLADFLAASDPGRPTYAHTFYPTGRSMRYALSLADFETVMTKSLSGSIYIAARPASRTKLPRVWPALTRELFRTKELRYALIGRPNLLFRRMAKSLLRR